MPNGIRDFAKRMFTILGINSDVIRVGVGIIVSVNTDGTLVVFSGLLVMLSIPHADQSFGKITSNSTTIIHPKA